MNSLFQFEIPKRQQVCALHGERLESGKEIFSLLYEEADSKKMLREDYCSKCWPKIEEKPNRIYWKSKIEKKNQEPQSTRSERALNLLKELLIEPNANEEEIFVLSLLLSHARQLILRKEIVKESQLFHLYEVAKQEEYITVKVFDLNPTQITNVQQSLAEKLNSCAVSQK